MNVGTSKIVAIVAISWVFPKVSMRNLNRKTFGKSGQIATIATDFHPYPIKTSLGDPGKFFSNAAQRPRPPRPKAQEVPCRTTIGTRKPP